MPRSSDNPLHTLEPLAPASNAAIVVLSTRLGEVARQLAILDDAKLDKSVGRKAVHALRVATRRAEAGLDAFEPVLEADVRKQLTRTLKKLRKAAGALRDPHVRKKLLSDAAKDARTSALRLAYTHVAERVRELELGAAKPFRKTLTDVAKDKTWSAAIADSAALVHAEGTGRQPLAALARTHLRSEVDGINTLAQGDLKDIEHVHQLRIAIKRFRYAFEIFETSLTKKHRRDHAAALAGLQKTLGDLNDAYGLCQEIAAATKAVSKKAADKPLRDALDKASSAQQKALKVAHIGFVRAWINVSSDGLFSRIVQDVIAIPMPEPVVPRQQQHVEIKLAKKRGAEAKPAESGVDDDAAEEPARSNASPRRRLAAIDVGTNSVRLIVAETGEDGSYRVLDDEKEITRLGKGLHATGRMDESCIEHTAETIARMRSIAEGYGARELRVVGTSAAREAANGPDLLRRIREAAGVDMEVISGDEEAMLAFRSASRAFDLAAQPSLVFDIGGGSVELILSAAASARAHADTPRSALIEHVYSLPLGAVRLTEKFGGAETVSVERFKELKQHIKRSLREAVGRPPIWPQLVIGTGGSLTTLGAMSMQQGSTGNGMGLFGKVQGAIVGRAQVKHLLDYARKLPVKDRSRIAGLSADRVDIIVAGLAVVDVLLKYFGANQLRIHEGGIRDGLLLTMVGGASASRDDAARPDPIRSVKRFAKECNYEAAHA